MEVVAHEEATINATASAKDQSTVVVKGKRTKRLRPQSPIPFSFTAASSNENSTPATSAEHESSTEDEEDMANCLILLAQGRRSPPPPPPPSPPLPHQQSSDKFSSRKFLADHHQSSGGSYVYECKTCNRTFPSFQALGGHRASHKKPPKSLNLSLSDHSKPAVFSAGFPPEEEHNPRHHFKPNVMTLSLHLSTARNHSSNNSNHNEVYGSASKAASNKVHECSICGAEFTSGQALGGHMRRHRAAPSPATAQSLSPTHNNVSLAATPLTVVEPEPESHDRQQPRKRARSVLSLDLDLNLPAPEDDNNQHREAGNSKLGGFLNPKQQQQQSQQQSSLVFTAPALVDCHY